MRGPLWTEGVPPSKRAEGAHAAEPANATASKRSRQRQQSASLEQRQQTSLCSLAPVMPASHLANVPLPPTPAVFQPASRLPLARGADRAALAGSARTVVRCRSNAPAGAPCRHPWAASRQRCRAGAAAAFAAFPQVPMPPCRVQQDLPPAPGPGEWLCSAWRYAAALAGGRWHRRRAHHDDHDWPAASRRPLETDAPVAVEGDQPPAPATSVLAHNP